MKKTFTVITPTWNRNDGRLHRAMQSIKSQTLFDYEHIVVDDGSTDRTKGMVISFPCTEYIHIEHAGRVVARNRGMERASGDWICWLDSDDAYDPTYLETLQWHINQESDAKLWVLGAIVHGVYKDATRHYVPVWTKIRTPQVPPLDESGRWVHAHFPSGTVGTGMFAFHRSCLDVTGVMPDWANHNFVADGVDEWLGYETGYGVTKKLVGNPWGDDWAMFRKLTQYYQVYKIDAALYVHYVR